MQFDHPLLIQILELPNLPHAETTLDAFAEIFHRYHIQTEKEFEALFQDQPIIFQHLDYKVSLYLTRWFTVTNNLIKLNHHILEVGKKSLAKLLSNDVLFPITIALLPCDLSLLKKLEKKLKLAIKLAVTGEGAFYLINFYNAVSTKILEIKEGNKVILEDANAKIIETLNEYEKVVFLKSAVNEYLEIIAEHFYLELPKYDYLAYLYYCQVHLCTHEDLLLHVLQDMAEENNMLRNNEFLQSLIKKYQAFIDLNNKLNHFLWEDKQKIAEFGKTIKEYNTVLEKKIYISEEIVLRRIFYILELNPNVHLFLMLPYLVANLLHNDSLDKVTEKLTKWFPAAFNMKQNIRQIPMRLFHWGDKNSPALIWKEEEQKCSAKR